MSIGTQKVCTKSYKSISVKCTFIKLLFTERDFCPSLLRLVDTLYTVIHKTQKARTKVLPSATVGE